MLTFVILYNYLRDFLDGVRKYALHNRRVQVIMAAKTLLQDYVTWIKDEQKLHESDRHETNYRSVNDALVEQKKRVMLVRELVDEINEASILQQEEVDSSLLANSYSDLSFLSEKRLECLRDVHKLSTLEENFNSLSVSADKMSVQLVEAKENKAEGDELSIPEGDASVKAVQECIYVVKSNWSWMNQLVSCLDTHLKNASTYHEFFYEVGEVERLMSSQFQELAKLFRTARAAEGIGDANRLNEELKELISTILYWQGRIDELQEKSKEIIPVHLRTQPLHEDLNVIALCSYCTKEITIKEGETLKLIDNSSSKSWKVCNSRGQEADVPPIICLLPGSNKKAATAITRLMLELLDAYTEIVQLTGRRLILFLSLVFWEYTEEKANNLTRMAPSDNSKLGSVCDYIDEALVTHWSSYSGYTKLHIMLEKLKTTAEENCSDELTEEEKVSSAKILQSIRQVEEIIRNYQCFWQLWEAYKQQLETSEDPICMDLLQSWQQQRIIKMPRYSEGELDIEKLIFSRSVCVESLELNEVSDQGDGEELSYLTGTQEPEEASRLADMSNAVIKEDHLHNLSRKDEFIEKSVSKHESISPDLVKDTVPLNEDQSSSTSSPRQDETDFEIVPDTAVLNNAQLPNGSVSLHVREEEYEILTSGEFTSAPGSTDKNIELLNESEPIYKICIGGGEKIVKIVSILDDRGGLLSVSDAVECGVFDIREGTYRENKSSDPLSLIDAIFLNKICIENLSDTAIDSGTCEIPFFTVLRPDIPGLQAGIFRSDFEGESRDFQIIDIIDDISKEHLDVHTAVEQGLLNLNKGLYSSTSTGKDKAITSAVKDGHIVVKILSESDKFEDKWNNFATFSYDSNELVIATTVGGEQNKFTVDGVIDTKNGKFLSCKDAKQQHVLDFISFLYIDTQSGECLTLPEAIRQGKILVSLHSQTCDCGFIIIGGGTTDESMVYSARFADGEKFFRIKRVVNPLTMQQMKPGESTNLFDPISGVYTHPGSQERMTATYAIDIGLLIVEYVDIQKEDLGLEFRFIGVDPVGPVFSANLDGVSKSFRIKEVRCKKTNRHLSLPDAVRVGLFNVHTGWYENKVDNSNLCLTQAINNGLLDLEFIERKSVKFVADNDFVVEDGEGLQLFSSTIDGERKVFIIMSVNDTISKKTLSLKEALEEGIVDLTRGMYIDLQTGDVLTIPQAVAKSYINIDLIYNSKSSLNKSTDMTYVLPVSDVTNDLYTATINSAQETFAVEEVYDHDTHSTLPLPEAKNKGIIDLKHNSYCLKANTFLTIPAAVENGFIKIKHIDLDKDSFAPLPDYVLLDSLNGYYVYRASSPTSADTVLIRSVFDPVSDSTITVDEAVLRKLFNPNSGEYAIPKTGQIITLRQALLLNLVNVAKISHIPSEPPTQDISGSLHAVKLPYMVHDELKWFVVSNVLNVRDDTFISLAEAEKIGIFDIKKRLFIDNKTGQSIDFDKAIRTGLINVTPTENQVTTSQHNEFKMDTSADRGPLCTAEMENRIRTFTIDSIIDNTTYLTLNLHDAVNRGIFDPFTGSYLDGSTGETLSFSQAYHKNYIQVDFRDGRDEPSPPKSHQEDMDNLDGEELIRPQKVGKTETERPQLKTSEPENTGIEVIDFINDKPILKSNVNGRDFSYQLKSILDSSTGKLVTIQEAIALGIVDLEEGKYFDRESGNTISIDRAVELHFLEIEPLAAMQAQESAKISQASPEIRVLSVTDADTRGSVYNINHDGKEQSFFVNTIIDPITKETLTREEAVARGIFEPTTGLYINPKTGRKVRIDIALKLQLITANYVELTVPKTTKTEHTQESGPAIQFYTAPIDGVKRTFIIKGVRDIVNGSIISMQDAIEKGIVNKKKGVFINNSTRESESILKAITRGWITVEFIEKDSILGDITQCRRLNIITSSDESVLSITNSEDEHKCYTITGVVHPETKKTIPMTDAMALGIVETKMGRYVDITTGETLPIVVAVSKGLILVEEKVDQAEVEKKLSDIQFSASRERSEIETEQHLRTVQEEKKTFTITGVVNPRTKKEIALKDAVALGIIDSKSGSYVNTLTGDKMPIPLAIDQGLIKVEFVETKKSKEEATSVGLITIETTREKQSFVVTFVMDASKTKSLTIDESVERGIFDETTGQYRNLITKEELSLTDAIEQGFVIGEYDTSPSEDTEPEVITQTFSVTGVLDHKLGKPVSFHEAVQTGLLDGEMGTYHNNVTGESMFLGDAITEGFIVATLVEDPSNLNVKPENKMVFNRDRIAAIRRKIINPLKAIRAMKGFTSKK